jgi:FtsP/CotA-like multicopper oxidase with cupredoxin domain
VNGKIHPAVDPIRVRKGDKVKLRIANPSAATIYYLRLAGHVLTITHADGNPIKPTETDVLRIGMGERYDVMFVADNPGHWLLAAAEQGFGEGRLRVPVFYEGVQRQNAIAPAFRSALRMAAYRDFEAANPSSYGAVGDARFYDQILSGGMHSPHWTINGRSYPDADNLMVKKGERVRLRYGNHSMMPHPMHLHGHFFKIVNPALPRQRWVAKDTLVVEHMERIEVEFEADNPGNWFHHCHNLYHMEAGMANVIRYQ